MKLRTATKILLLLLTLLPSVWMAFFVATFFLMFNAAPKNDPIFNHFGWFFGIHFGVMLLMFALLAFYVVFLFKTSAVRTDMKALWAVVLFFGGPLAMPVFWYLYIWRKPKAAELPEIEVAKH